MVFDETLTNVALGKTTSTNSESTNATFFGSQTAVNGILQSDVPTADSDGFVSTGNCATTGTGTIYWMVDLGAMYNVSGLA